LLQICEEEEKRKEPNFNFFFTGEGTFEILG
jgi:hypothetical protein